MTEIPAASMAQVVRGRGGAFVCIEDDVCSIASQLQEIDSRLRLRYSTSGGYFVVYQLLDDGSEHLVTTCVELDARLVRKIRRLTHESYDLATELDDRDRAYERDLDDRFSQRVGDAAQRLRHAMRSDLGLPGPVPISRSIAKGTP